MPYPLGHRNSCCILTDYHLIIYCTAPYCYTDMTFYSTILWHNVTCVCVCVCVCVYVCVCTIHTYIYSDCVTGMHLHTHVCTCVHMYVKAYNIVTSHLAILLARQLVFDQTHLLYVIYAYKCLCKLNTKQVCT